MSDKLVLMLLQSDSGKTLCKSAAERILELESCLKDVESWDLPKTDRFFPDGTRMSYSSAYGSNGEREYFRTLAGDALRGIKK